MKKRFIAILLCILLILTGLPMKSFAAEKTSAKLIEIEGDIQIIRSGGEKPFKAFLNMKLSEGDRIITGSSATAKIKLDDEVVITLAENTSIYLSELRDSKGSKQSSINLQSGGVGSSIKKKLTENARFEIKTPTAVMGVRGTEFFTQFINGNVDIKVIDGTVEILVNIDEEGDITGVSQGEIRNYRFLVGALQQTNFTEGQTAKELPKTLESLDLKGLPIPFLERIKEIVKEDSDSIPKEISDTIEDAIKEAIADKENKSKNNKLMPDEFSSNSGIGNPSNIQQSNPITTLPGPKPTPTQDPGSNETPVPNPDPIVPVESVTIDQSSISLEVGQTDVLTASVNPENASNKNITWSSSDASVASVDNVGVVTAISPGSANITVTTVDGGKSASTEVTIIPANVPVESISIDQSSIPLEVGETSSLVATVNPENASNKNVIWKSSNIEIATVDNLGKVSAVSSGSATITVTSEDGDKTASIAVTVTAPITTPLEYFEFDLQSKPGEAILTEFYPTGNNLPMPLNEIFDPIIPSQVNGIPVTVIGDNAFQEVGITSVIIPETVTIIREGAFAYNSLTSIVFPKDLKTIGNSAFEHNTLKSIELPKNLETIGDSAFLGNSALNIVSIGSNVSIGVDLFSYADDTFKYSYEVENNKAEGTYYKGSKVEISEDLENDFSLIGTWSLVEPEEYFDIIYNDPGQKYYNPENIVININNTNYSLNLFLISYIEGISYVLSNSNENVAILEFDQYGYGYNQYMQLTILAEGEIEITITASVEGYSKDHTRTFLLKIVNDPY